VDLSERLADQLETVFPLLTGVQWRRLVQKDRLSSRLRSHDCAFRGIAFRLKI
jgi:hypothetical protein